MQHKPNNILSPITGFVNEKIPGNFIYSSLPSK
jgi:hypothetical protein